MAPVGALRAARVHARVRFPEKKTPPEGGVFADVMTAYGVFTEMIVGFGRNCAKS
jgi:hypothetical protein